MRLPVAKREKNFSLAEEDGRNRRITPARTVKTSLNFLPSTTCRFSSDKRLELRDKPGKSSGSDVEGHP